jgi:hypothetical protein
VPICMRWVNQFIRCDDWKYRYAALMCLFAIIEVLSPTQCTAQTSGSACQCSQLCLGHRSDYRAASESSRGIRATSRSSS